LIDAMISSPGKASHSTGSSPNCVRSLAAEALLPSSVCNVDETTMNHQAWRNSPSAIVSLEASIPDTAQCPINETIDESTDCASSMSLPAVRNSIFLLSIRMGQLSAQFLQARNWLDLTSIPEEVLAVISTELGHMIIVLMELSNGLSIDLHGACMKKIHLNERKYPVELCRVSAMGSRIACLSVH
jgi:hypothetical protein